jgi:hypothetical protein
MLCVASHWKATIHIYDLNKKFQNIQKFIAFTAACPESLNSIYNTTSVKSARAMSTWLFHILIN